LRILRPLRLLLLRCRRRRRGRFRLAASALRTARQDGVHLVAFHPRHGFGEGKVRQLPDQALENPPRHLAAPEEDRRLDLVAILEEALDVLLLELVVVLVDLRAELDLFDLDHLLVLASLTRALLLLVLVLAEISTRSSPFCLAIASACGGGMMPSCAPVSSITRISRTRMRSLTRVRSSRRGPLVKAINPPTFPC